MVPVISQKRENRPFSAAMSPEEAAGEPILPGYCQGQPSMRKSCATVIGRKTPFAPSLSVTILSSEVSQISTFPKFMEELIMPFKRAQVPSQREILSLAEDWGKVVARRAFGDEGPDLDLNFDAIEAVAFQAAQAVIKGTIQQSLSQQMRKLGETQPCPQCRRVCPVETEPRELVVRGATVQYDEPKCHCPTCRRDFFPSPSRVAT